jgi:hypothetical protein
MDAMVDEMSCLDVCYNSIKEQHLFQFLLFVKSFSLKKFPLTNVKKTTKEIWLSPFFSFFFVF